MPKYTEIQNYSFRDILNNLGEEASQGAEFHVHYKEELLAENPFPYPFRSSNTGVMLMLQGKMKVQINLETFIAGPGSVLVFPAQAIVHILEIIEPLQNIGIVFTEEFALRNILNYEEVRVFRFIELNETPVLTVSGADHQAVSDLFIKLSEINSSDSFPSPYKKEKTFHYFNLLALEMMEIYRSQSDKFNLKTNRKKEIIQEFLSLLPLHVREKRNVQFYADKLFITPGHLSKLLKEATGSTSREIIEEAVVMEARNMLVDTSLSLAEIAERLHFSDQSFFGKFFKKKMKITPKSFRDKYK